MNIAKLGTRLASGIALTVFAQTAAFAQTAQPQVTDDTETSYPSGGSRLSPRV